MDKFIIYQLLPRVFGNRNANCICGGTFEQNGSGKFDDISTKVLESLRVDLSVRYVWFTGIIRHATKPDKSVKGQAGSPYAIKDYYDVNPYMANQPQERMNEFKSLLDRTHKAGLGVIIDFVPNHLSCEYCSSRNSFGDDNFYPDRIHDGDWTDTVKLNYSVRDTWLKMRDILLFWSEMGVDGFRCDMVELVPVEFWAWCIPQIKKRFPSVIFVAEIYQPLNYNSYISVGGFDYLYDKSGFYDTLRAILTNGKSASELTQVWQSLHKFQPNMLNFLENHDEQRVASDFFLGSAEKSMPALYVSLLFNTAPFMIYSGQEFGERGMEHEGFSGIDGKSSIFDFWSISTIRRWLNGLDEGRPLNYLNEREKEFYQHFSQIMRFATQTPAIKRGLTFDLGYVNPHSQWFDPHYHFAFLRFSQGAVYLCAANFSERDSNLRIHIPYHAFEYFGILKNSSISSMGCVDIFVSQYGGVIKKIL